LLVLEVRITATVASPKVDCGPLLLESLASLEFLGRWAGWRGEGLNELMADQEQKGILQVRKPQNLASPVAGER